MVEPQQTPFHSDVSVEDGSNEFGLPSDAGIKEIALLQFQRCCLEGSKEMNKGGMVQKYVNGQFVEVEAPNQREVFINAVRILHTVLLPELMNYKELIKEINDLDADVRKIEEEKQTEFKAFKEKYRVNKTLSWEKNVKPIQDSLELFKVELSHRKLIVLSILLKELNYFKEGGGSF